MKPRTCPIVRKTIPARMPRPVLAGPRKDVNVQIVITKIAIETNATSAPIKLNTAASNTVELLKCEGTPRQRCRSMRSVSGTKSEVATADGRAQPGGARQAAHHGRQRERRDPTGQPELDGLPPRDRAVPATVRQRVDD